MTDEDNDEVLDALNADEGLGEGQGGLSDKGRMGEEGAEPSERPSKPVSVRDSIREAIKEEAKTPEEKSEERNKNLEKAREARKAKSVERKSNIEVGTNKDALDKVTSSKTENVSKDVSTPKSDSVQPPNGWTKEAKALWAQLPDEIKQSVAKREKEASDGFKTYGDIKKKYDELEAVIAPRRATIQRFGVSEAQTVDRLFQWMDSLTGPNKLNSWLALGQNFGINVNDILQQAGGVTKPQTNPQQGQQPQQQNQIPDAVKTYVESAVGQVNNYVQQQKQEAANSFLTNWSKDKPHFQQVRGTMFALLSSNVIPQKDGNLDLDTAYDYACNANPEVRTALAEATQAETERKAAEDAQKAEAQRIIQVNKARKAGTSLRPSAPTPGMRPSKPNSGGKALSVRDSIKNSISELSN